MTFIIEIASYDLQLLGDLLWKVLQPQEGITTCSNQMIEH